MAGFGEKLRQARESREFTLAQVAEATRISVRYLEALESDNLSALPGSVFNKGYVRSFAKFIGADPEALVEAYVAEEEAQERDGRISRPDVMAGLAQAVERNSQRRRGAGPRRRVPLLALLVLVLLALGAWSLTRIGSSSGVPSVASNTVSPPIEQVEPAAQFASAEQTDEIVPATEPAEKDRSSTPPADVAVARDAPTETDRPAVTEPVAKTTAPQPTPAPPQESPVPVQSTRSEPPTKTTPPALETKTSPAGTAATGHVSITEFGVGTEVVNRRLVGRSDRFDPGTRVWFWNRVVGANKGERIRHVWIHEGQTVSSIELTIGGSHWRTQSLKTLRAPGHWAVEARDAENRVLARTDFVCGAPS